MAKRAKAQTSKIKKKRWYPIYSNQGFNKAFLGESTVSELPELIGKHMLVNLMNITNDMKKQSINIRFKVVKTAENSGLADPVGYIMSPSFIKKIVRRRKSKIDISFSSITKDKIPVIVKVLIITMSTVPNSVSGNLRRGAVKVIEDALKENTYIETLEKIISNNIQKAIREQLKKTYPLKIVEIRYFAHALPKEVKKMK